MFFREHFRMVLTLDHVTFILTPPPLVIMFRMINYETLFLGIVSKDKQVRL